MCLCLFPPVSCVLIGCWHFTVCHFSFLNIWNTSNDWTLLLFSVERKPFIYFTGLCAGYVFFLLVTAKLFFSSSYLTFRNVDKRWIQVGLGKRVQMRRLERRVVLQDSPGLMCLPMEGEEQTSPCTGEGCVWDIWRMSALWWVDRAWMFPRTRNQPATHEKLAPVTRTHIIIIQR